jgi:uncharacterized protein YbaR (Trm112 family)
VATLEQVLSNLNISPDDWVLEIGSGPLPFRRSDILADRYLSDNTERPAGNLVIDRPLVICDAHNLPFADRSFDYIFCSQLLEHLEDPARFFSEIARVAPKGYLETPNELRERLLGWTFHRWIVRVEEGELVLRPKDTPHLFGSLFHDLQQENYSFGEFVWYNHDLLNVCFEWEGRVPYRIEDSPDRKRSSDPAWWLINLNISIDDMRRDSPRRAREVLRNAIAWRVRRYLLKTREERQQVGKYRPKEQSIERLDRILICPSCQAPVKVNRNRGQVSCPGCDRTYPMKGQIPILLEDEDAIERILRGIE